MQQIMKSEKTKSSIFEQEINDGLLFTNSYIRIYIFVKEISKK